MRLRRGTNAKIVHHLLRPARCKMFATGTATRMMNRSGMMMAMSQCHSAGTALQIQNSLQKLSISFSLIRNRGALGYGSAHHHHGDHHHRSHHEEVVWVA